MSDTNVTALTAKEEACVREYLNSRGASWTTDLDEERAVKLLASLDKERRIANERLEMLKAVQSMWSCGDTLNGIMFNIKNHIIDSEASHE